MHAMHIVAVALLVVAAWTHNFWLAATVVVLWALSHDDPNTESKTRAHTENKGLVNPKVTHIKVNLDDVLLCLDSLLCRHPVTIFLDNGDVKQATMYRDEILALYAAHNIPVHPNFSNH